MVITNEMKLRLAELIREAIGTNFEYVHLSGNLVNTIEIYQDFYYYIDEKTGELVRFDKVIIDVIAPRYSISTYLRTGAIVYTGKGSYASTVDKHGGFTGKHKNYAENAISLAVSAWLREYNLEANIL